MKRLLLLFLMLVGGCAIDADRWPIIGLHARHIHPGVPVTFERDPAFSPNESAELDVAAAAVAPRLLVRFVSGAGDGAIVRGVPDFGRPLVGDEHVAYSEDLFTMWVDAEKMPPGSIATAVQGMLEDLSAGGGS